MNICMQVLFRGVGAGEEAVGCGCVCGLVWLTGLGVELDVVVYTDIIGSNHLLS